MLAKTNRYLLRRCFMEKHVLGTLRGICRGGGVKALLVLVLIAFTAHFTAAQEEEGEAAGLILGIEFNGSLVSVNSEGVVDSMADSGFNEDETKIGIGYEGELWGAMASLAFNNELLRITEPEGADMIGENPLSIDELYAWIRPFGSYFTFTGGIFENTDGVADYTDDLDDFSLGVFVLGEDGPFTEPEVNTNAALVSGFLAGATLGPVTLQFQFAPNFSKETGSDFVNDFLSQISGGQMPPTENTARYFRIGGRVIADLGFGTVSALFKTYQFPINMVNSLEQVMGLPGAHTGTKQNYSTFGGYFDFTAVENLGLSLGYTGFLTGTDEEAVENTIWSGIDLRAAWTGIEGLSISTHNNISFATGSDTDMMGLGNSRFFNLYNAVGVTKELTDRFSVNLQVGNVFTKISDVDGDGYVKADTLWVEPKFIAAVGEHAEFSIGVRLDVANEAFGGGGVDESETVTTFSVPVGITISF
jgi:hypothetical protein